MLRFYFGSHTLLLHHATLIPNCIEQVQQVQEVFLLIITLLLFIVGAHNDVLCEAHIEITTSKGG
jgi:hypothetical protein